jgi:hypothetical protein
LGDRSRGRFATPAADFPLHDGSPYSHVHIRRDSLGLVHRSRTILCRSVPNPSVTIRNVCIAVRRSYGDQALAERNGETRSDAMVRASAVTALVGLTDCAEAVAVKVSSQRTLLNLKEPVETRLKSPTECFKVVELLMCDDRTTRTLAVSLLARLGEPVAAFASDVVRPPLYLLSLWLSFSLSLPLIPLSPLYNPPLSLSQVRVMEHAQPGVREAAVEVMCHLLRWPAAAHHVANLVPLLADDDACVRAAVVAGFRGGSLGRRTLALAAEKVLELMGYVDLPRDEQRAYAGVCRSAHQCLNAILSVTDEPAPLMQLAQQHSNPVICQAVMDVLAVMAAPQLLAHADYVRSVLLENAESTVRERGLGLLQACGAAAKPLAPSMRLLLADTHASVRGAALHALAALGPAAAAEEVQHASGHTQRRGEPRDSACGANACCAHSRRRIRCFGIS